MEATKGTFLCRIINNKLSLSGIKEYNALPKFHSVSHSNNT